MSAFEDAMNDARIVKAEDDDLRCPTCEKAIRWSYRDGWVHSDTRSVWCAGGPIQGSCVLGPKS